MNSFYLLFPLIMGVLLISCAPAQANPESLSALLQRWTSPAPVKAAKKASKKQPVKALPKVLPLAPEYQIYIETKAQFEKKIDLKTIEAIEQKILGVKLNAETRALDKEFEELFYAFELKRAERLSKVKQWTPALHSFTRGLNGLNAFKWIFYWRTETSEALSKICKLKAKETSEACMILAKRVIDAFPKAALETKVLRDLPALEISTNSESNNGDRLSQGYSEKTEKDEEAFVQVLDDFLNHRERDLADHGNTFIQDFPKSILRFRTLFLMAETDFKANRKKEAKAKYDQIIDQVPLSFYALVAAERNGTQLRDSVKKDPLMVDLDQLTLQYSEKQTLARAESLFVKKHYDEVALELETLTRLKNYSSETILYLMGLASRAEQSLSAFRIANELIQRRYDGLLQNEFLSMIFPERFTDLIEEQSKIFKIDPIWVTSLMKQESGFRATILSSSGALGLMQLMPFTAIDVQKDVVLSSLKNPSLNIAIGTKYIASLADRYNGNMVFALAAYNGGPHRVSKWKKEAKPEWEMIEFIESIPYKETREYVMAILRNRYWYSFKRGLPGVSVLDAGFDLKKAPSDTPRQDKTATTTSTSTVTSTATSTQK